MTSSHSSRSNCHPADAGYVLLAILLMVTVLMFATLSTAPLLRTQVQRNQEAEMIHRGVQYSRAIKRYFAKFGRYPTSLEQLDDTNNIRFLRKEYKDPMMDGGQWRLLHWGDVAMNFSRAGTPAGVAGSRTSRTVTQVEGEIVVWANSSGSPSGSSGNSSGAGATSTSAAGIGGSSAGATSNTTDTSQTSTTDTSQTSTTDNSATSGTMKTFTAAAIIGVASNSEKEGLHVFNGKTQYSQWYFVYDPTLDNGALIRRPYTGLTSNNSAGVVVQAPASNSPQSSEAVVPPASGEQQPEPSPQ